MKWGYRIRTSIAAGSDEIEVTAVQVQPVAAGGAGVAHGLVMLLVGQDVMRPNSPADAVRGTVYQRCPCHPG
jgi:hypothetical protein